MGELTGYEERPRELTPVALAALVIITAEPPDAPLRVGVGPRGGDGAKAIGLAHARPVVAVVGRPAPRLVAVAVARVVFAVALTALSG